MRPKKNVTVFLTVNIFFQSYYCKRDCSHLVLGGKLCTCAHTHTAASPVESSSKEQPEDPRARGKGQGMCLVASSFLYGHHDLVQRLPLEVWHRGIFAGIPHRKQHQQFFIVWTAQEHPQTGSTVKRSGCDSYKPCVLKQERRNTLDSSKVRTQLWVHPRDILVLLLLFVLRTHYDRRWHSHPGITLGGILGTIWDAED